MTASLCLLLNTSEREHVRRSIPNFEKTVELLLQNYHLCYVNSIISLVKFFGSSTCDTFFSKNDNLERLLVDCIERLERFYPKNVYELRECIFEKLDAFKFPYKNEQFFFENLAVFDFELTNVEEETYKETETTNWIGEPVAILVSILSNFPILSAFLVFIILSCRL